MAGDWIKMRTALADDPAVIAMADRLGLDEFSVVGRLHHLWSWADSQSRDGHAVGVTVRWLNRYVQCDGFAEALAHVGWLTIDDQGIRFPNFDRHNGESAKARGLAKNRKEKQRAKVTDESGQMSRNERDNCVTREEKSKEQTDTGAGDTDPAGDLGGPQPMTLDWQPDQKTLKAYAFSAGLTMDQFTEQVVGGFRVHHHSRGTVDLPAGWVGQLVGWVRRDATRSASQRPNLRAVPSGQSVDFDSTGWLAGDLQ
ncbi:DnaT-like ssDNA-binding domain-containing protein [Pseudomonas pseudonitroreducens]|uniref:DnaT-like ssDNA-binding domain-containing protein n=1 Tax=Pseudomonas pseudonitroreducens TaxID=2892326 RepID=UPI001EEE21C0|nr:DnaT-like ssDNA-binding domain-containing protein [Pseudomonas pseudonitroreducens]